MENNPFLGARPYGAADDLVFFGRSDATATLLERLYLRPLTIVTSQSGIGKTSLLRAAVLPQLEAGGLCPVYLRPDPGIGGDAASTLLEGRLAEAMAVSLLPDLNLERDYLWKLRAAAPRANTLAEARSWFATLPAQDQVRRELLTIPDGPVEFLPMLARFLRGTLAPEAMATQLARLGGTRMSTLTPEITLDGAASCLCDPELSVGAVNARARLREAYKCSKSGRDDIRGPVSLLTQGREGETPLLARPDGDSDLSVRIVLIIDQFEQIFTLAGPETRMRVMSMFGDLLTVNLPVHLVLMLRKEWYADLVQLLSQFHWDKGSAERITFYLQPMTRSEALEVMIEAPRQVGFDAITPAQQEALWNGLQQDDAVDAVALSIACHELFAIGESAQSLLTVEGIEGLLEAYLRRAIDTIADPVDRDEALDILGEIVGSDTTRTFIAQRVLLNAPLRDPERRERMLFLLQRAFLIKGDNPGRSYDKVYDVMHERLLGPLRALIAKHPGISAFREAASRISQVDGRGWLDWNRCCALLSGWRRAAWDSHSAGILLRSLIQELTRERLGDMARRRGSVAEIAPPDQEPLVWLREIFAKLALETAIPPVRALPAERWRLSWWMTPAEVQRRTAEPPDREWDALAMASALWSGRGLMRDKILQLAVRLSNSSNVEKI
jgi:hypothetical protein